MIRNADSSIINLGVERSDLVRHLTNKALKDCHNPFRTELHMERKQVTVNQDDMSRQMGKTG